MNLLASYFQKIRSLLKDKAFEKSVVTAGVKEIIKIDIPEDCFRVTDEGVVYVKGSSSLKNALFLKKKEIKTFCERNGVRIIDFR
ncbi:MAG: hypothetical protein A2741_00955 [Candidatus Zambryskibacteria bacterium RIFCSPHIGHO2_01_FULL_43_27]|uniref:Uncharacterized protein n=1 Tax=Candidatus Zambryskibacteria bacterium RIFCSPLOWO2_01_FULL_43_17 TaxID=1802760 RepID=A0A1G2U6M0_9BACT|nr:MAG: hypothetical protein A2741_00955 [Candidatus Zambryskibacteria bacterium RIFCSPHIGHO2_01_FULL_43_27]OHB00071.1 MAG: hypothetical protein A3E93_01950 [Candidatus Zambryskibacteria bacterium RIFCSPHIGHO2_12_FULL_43_12b]OHB04602.1 MAG: hypothetical protein A2920_01535 [Candidatus Zambryskibacteria bacterium RIFCSPLOWO2_01_FULL_43_17]